MALYGNEVASLRYGDEVAVSRGYRFGRVHFEFTKVVKITPTGRVTLANGLRFNKEGRQLSAGYYSRSMWNAEEARERQAESEKQAAMEQRFAGITNKLSRVSQRSGGSMYMDDKVEDRKQLATDLRAIADEIENF